MLKTTFILQSLLQFVHLTKSGRHRKLAEKYGLLPYPVQVQKQSMSCTKTGYHMLLQSYKAVQFLQVPIRLRGIEQLSVRYTLHASCITYYLVSAEDAPWGRLLLCSSEAFKRYQNRKKIIIHSRSMESSLNYRIPIKMSVQFFPHKHQSRLRVNYLLY